MFREPAVFTVVNDSFTYQSPITYGDRHVLITSDCRKSSSKGRSVLLGQVLENITYAQLLEYWGFPGNQAPLDVCNLINFCSSAFRCVLPWLHVMNVSCDLMLRIGQQQLIPNKSCM